MGVVAAIGAYTFATSAGLSATTAFATASLAGTVVASKFGWLGETTETNTPQADIKQVIDPTEQQEEEDLKPLEIATDDKTVNRASLTIDPEPTIKSTGINIQGVQGVRL